MQNRLKNKVNVYLPSLVMEVPDHVYVLGDTYTCHTLIIKPIRVKNDMHSSNKCDMYMCHLRHIHDPVLPSQKLEGIS
jgi:hypothetical protein